MQYECWKWENDPVFQVYDMSMMAMWDAIPSFKNSRIVLFLLEVDIGDNILNYKVCKDDFRRVNANRRGYQRFEGNHLPSWMPLNWKGDEFMIATGPVKKKAVRTGLEYSEYYITSSDQVRVKFMLDCDTYLPPEEILESTSEDEN